MNQAKERYKLELDPPDYPVILPEMRRLIIIIDYDFGKTVHILKLMKTNRIDLFKVFCDGKLWKNGIGFSRILQGIRKSLPRVKAI